MIGDYSPSDACQYLKNGWEDTYLQGIPALETPKSARERFRRSKGWDVQTINERLFGVGLGSSFIEAPNFSPS